MISGSKQIETVQISAMGQVKMSTGSNQIETVQSSARVQVKMSSEAKLES